MKEKTKKLILFITLCVVTIAILFIVIKLNENRKKELLNTSLIGERLTEIQYDGIASHVVEVPNTVIYVSNSSEDESEKFEKMFSLVIKQYNLENEIIYINIYNETLIDPFYQHAPELIFYTNGEVSDMVDCTTLNSKNDIIKILRERSIIND